MQLRSYESTRNFRKKESIFSPLYDERRLKIVQVNLESLSLFLRDRGEDTEVDLPEMPDDLRVEYIGMSSDPSIAEFWCSSSTFDPVETDKAPPRLHFKSKQ